MQSRRSSQITQQEGHLERNNKKQEPNLSLPKEMNSSAQQQQRKQRNSHQHTKLETSPQPVTGGAGKITTPRGVLRLWQRRRRCLTDIEEAAKSGSQTINRNNESQPQTKIVPCNRQNRRNDNRGLNWMEERKLEGRSKNKPSDKEMVVRRPNSSHHHS
jgi:hypothetical protein